jgi:hypothetical protein
LSETDKGSVAEQLRTLLGVDIKFEKLSKDELVKLWQVLTNLGELAAVGGRTLRRTVNDKIFQKPLAEIIGQPNFSELMNKAGSEGGFLGFGIGPRFMKNLTEPASLPAKAKETPAQ